MGSVRGKVVSSRINVAPRGGNRIVHLNVPPLARRHHHLLTGRSGRRTRATGVDVHGTHHSTVRRLGGDVGASKAPRSIRGSTRTRIRGIRSGCVGGMSRLCTTGRGRVVAMWQIRD